MTNHEKWEMRMSVEPLINSGDILLNDDIEFLRQHTKAQVRMLLDRSTMKCQYNVELICAECGQKKMAKINKTRLIKLLNVEYICDECIYERKIREMQARARAILEKKQQRESDIQNFVDKYLDPHGVWDPDIRPKKRFSLMMRDFPERADDEIAAKIRNIEYNDFLQTPYWKAVASKKRAECDNKCNMCGARNVPIMVHHGDYARRGYEHKYYKSDLMCLCRKCHEKYHANKQNGGKHEIYSIRVATRQITGVGP